LLLSALLLGACQPDSQHTQAEPDRSSVAAGADACTSQPAREASASVETDGRLQRYQLTRRGTTRNTVLVDFGGPGLSILGGAFRLGTYAAEQVSLKGYNLLFLEEPWVTKVVPPSCDSAMTAFYHALRSDPQQSSVRATQATVACLGATTGGWGFSSAGYADAVRQIARKENLDLTGFVGYSFGAVRFSYVQGRGFQWSVLVRPYPMGVSGGDVVAARATALTGLLARAKNLAAQPDTSSASRSLPVTAFDVLSAQVQLSYLNDAEFKQYGREVVEGSNPARIGSLSDILWRRYGVEQI
jgi:hypothetical protein